MRVRFEKLQLLSGAALLLTISSLPLLAQTAAKPQSSTAKNITAKSTWRRECVKSGEFCLQVPASWKRGGDLLDGAALLVEETAAQISTKKTSAAQPSAPQPTPAQLSSGALELPVAEGKERPSAQELVEIILSPLTGSKSSAAETLERERTTVGGMATEVVKLKVHDENGDRIEMVAIVEGEGSTVYFVLLSAPFQDATRLDAVFERALESWALVAPQP